jgi:ribonuclease E
MEGQEAAATPTTGDFADTAPLASLPDLDLTGTNGAPASSNGNAPAADEQRRERRSRDRYGRDRRERGERGSREGAEGQAPAPAMVDFDLTQAPSAPAPADEAPRRSYFSAPAAEEPQSAPAVATPAPAAFAPAAATAAPTVVEAAAAAAPEAPAASAVPATVAPEAKGMPRVQPFTLPVDVLQQVASASGLQWVNSDADKVAAVQAAIAAEPQPVRVPRERPPAVVLDEGPLVLVETRRDLAAMKLPFEGPSA